MLPDIAKCPLWSKLLVGDHCSESYNLEQLAVSEIANQLRLVVIVYIPTVSSNISQRLHSQVAFPFLTNVNVNIYNFPVYTLNKTSMPYISICLVALMS